jgi:hypothetical protein
VVPLAREPVVRYLRRRFDGRGHRAFGTIRVTFDWTRLAPRSEVPA